MTRKVAIAFVCILRRRIDIGSDVWCELSSLQPAKPASPSQDRRWRKAPSHYRSLRAFPATSGQLPGSEIPALHSVLGFGMRDAKITAQLALPERRDQHRKPPRQPQDAVEYSMPK